MKQLSLEVECAYKRFTPEWRGEFESAFSDSEAEESLFLRSYRRLVSLQAWRSELLEERLSSEALAFFAEAHNDAVLSHVMAFLGCWRPSLQALRSTIENIYLALFYMDHPVELELWGVGKHRISRTDLEEYLRGHPRCVGSQVAKTGLDVLSKQYATLNHAVHASSKSFRMTDDTAQLHLSRSDLALRNKWVGSQSDVLRGVNLVLMAMFHGELQGAARKNLRKAISLELSDATKVAVRSDLKIVLLK